MSSVVDALLRGQRIEEKARASVVEVAEPSVPSAIPSVYDQQVRLLVQQLFLHPEQQRCQSVGFAAVDLQTDAAPLCLGVARRLSDCGKHNVALIDASLDSSPFGFVAGKSEVCGSNTFEFEPRLWIVQRQEWLGDTASQAISSENLARLSDLTRQFDFSILCCGPMSWLAARIGRVCDGLVLVLTANQTRRLVAQNIRDQLQAAQVAVLGTVLAERRFPIPTALYRKL